MHAGHEREGEQRVRDSPPARCVIDARPAHEARERIPRQGAEQPAECVEPQDDEQRDERARDGSAAQRLRPDRDQPVSVRAGARSCSWGARCWVDATIRALLGLTDKAASARSGTIIAEVDKTQHDPGGSLFGDAAETPASIAAALAPPAAAGHFDELRGTLASSKDALSPAWERFLRPSRPRRLPRLEPPNREPGAAGSRQRRHLQRLRRRATGRSGPGRSTCSRCRSRPRAGRRSKPACSSACELLDRVMADVYGPQQLLTQGLLPPALVQGPSRLPARDAWRAAAGRHAPAHRGLRPGARPDGNWWVVSQRTQAPSGLGYLLENRLIISRLFPEAFRDLHVQRLAAPPTARCWKACARCARAAHGAAHRAAHARALTTRPTSSTRISRAISASRSSKAATSPCATTALFLKTLQGLEPVHGILKRLDDEYLDPLELRSDSHLGVPGLLAGDARRQCAGRERAGLGASSNRPALLGFLPALSRHLLGEELQLPSLATWWCGERAAMEAVLPQLADGRDQAHVREPRRGRGRSASRSRGARSTNGPAASCASPTNTPCRLTCRCRRCPRGSTAIGRRPHRAAFAACCACSRSSDGPRSWRVLPGGLTRIAGTDREIASMQRGGCSADTWVLTDGEVDAHHAAARTASPPSMSRIAPHRHQPRGGEPVLARPLYGARREHHAPGAPHARPARRRGPVLAIPCSIWLTAVAPRQRTGVAGSAARPRKRGACSSAP